jgi:hypothetical protein
MYTKKSYVPFLGVLQDFHFLQYLMFLGLLYNGGWYVKRIGEKKKQIHPLGDVKKRFSCMHYKFLPSLGAISYSASMWKQWMKNVFVLRMLSRYLYSISNWSLWKWCMWEKQGHFIHWYKFLKKLLCRT